MTEPQQSKTPQHPVYVLWDVLWDVLLCIIIIYYGM